MGLFVNRILILLAVVALAACTTNAIKHDRSADRLEVAEAVFRALFRNNDSANMAGKVAAAICFNNRDPGSGFLERFSDLSVPFPRKAGLFVPVIPCSLVRYSSDTGESLHARTNQPVIVFTFLEVRFRHDGSAIAEGSYFEAGLSAAGYTFKLRQVDGKWIVASQSMDWIS